MKRRRSDEAGRGGITSLDAAMARYLEVSGLGSKLRDWPVMDAWRKALGEDLARRARPVAFRRGELVVEVDSAAHLHELKGFTGSRYKDIANETLGRPAIRKVSFKLKR